MMRSVFAASLAVASLTSIASADLIFQAGTQTGIRYNPQASAALPGGFTAANTIAFTNCLFEGGNTSVTLDSFTFGIRQLGGAPTVDIRIFIAEMDGAANLIASSVQDLGLVTVGAAAASATTLVNFNAGGISLAMNDLAGTGNPGFSGFYVGIRFEGANATSNLNGWRINNAPALGAAFNQFAAYDPTSLSLDYFAFTAPTPSYFYVDVNGSLVPAPGAVALLGLAGLTARRRRA
jgi:MYXO-CTERM domain-containing protein